MSPGRERLLVVSNRLPVSLERGEQGSWSSRAAAGGLVTALEPVLRQRGGIWIGWPGVVEEETRSAPLPERLSPDAGYGLRAVSLTASERDLYYHGFSNEILWPLFHDLQTQCTFEPSYWRAYREVNRRFARSVAALAGDDDLVWVHDYHLIPLAYELRALGVRSRLAFFLHIPFPPLDIFAKLPWRRDLLAFMLEYDVVGFQVRRDRRNFAACVRGLLSEARVHRRGELRRIAWRDREMWAGAFPISIDTRGFAAAAAQPGVAAAAERIRASVGGRHILLGVDRLDYTKGVPFKLAAMRELLRRAPELHREATLIQILAPSREEIPNYLEFKLGVEQQVGEINGEFGEPGWVPVQYIHRSFSHDELLAYYGAADVCLATPLKDGMNLVAKEYCAADLGRRGVLVLSEFAGAARELRRGALLVNPYDIEGMAETLRRACAMPAAERRTRMTLLQRLLRRRDIFHWAGSFLAYAGEPAARLAAEPAEPRPALAALR